LLTGWLRHPGKRHAPVRATGRKPDNRPLRLSLFADDKAFGNRFSSWPW